jgi:PBP1b-binding outer membrane lipoprotein LpoB
MNASILRASQVAVIVGASCLLFGCSSVRPPNPKSTSLRPNEQEPSQPILNKPLVADMLAACDAVARDLIESTVIQTAERPVVVEIRAIENATDAPLDCKIYTENIRNKIIQARCAKIAFRDETARPEVIQERINQMDQDYTVTERSESTNRSARVRTNGPVKDGQLLPDGPVAGKSTSQQEDKLTMNRSGTVAGKLADVDYFLKGKLYAQNEMGAGARDEGTKYYQFAFFLTDARTGVMPWAKTYGVKRVVAK